jgi:heme exporter protein B
MQIFYITFSQELLISSRHIGKILANFLFFIITVATFFLIAQNHENQPSTAFYSITIIWFSLLFSLIFSAADFLKKDFDDGTIEQIINSCDNFEIFILAKMLANWFISCLPIMLAIAPILLANDVSADFIFSFLTLIFLASLIINFICTFCGSLSSLGNSAPVIAIIALPLIIPILLIGYLGVLGEGLENFWTSFKLLFGLTVFIGCATVFCTAKIIKIAAD